MNRSALLNGSKSMVAALCTIMFFFAIMVLVVASIQYLFSGGNGPVSLLLFGNPVCTASNVNQGARAAGNRRIWVETGEIGVQGGRVMVV